jgi:hypothetical protein
MHARGEEVVDPVTGTANPSINVTKPNTPQNIAPSSD